MLISSLVLKLFILLCIYNCIQSFQVITSPFLTKSSLYGYRKGDFLDPPRPANKKMEDLAKRLGVDKKEVFTTGREMRSGRERNLKVVFNTQPDAEPNLYGIKTRKWSQEQIDAVIESLNASYEWKPREKLSDEQRVGLIDWDAFAVQANNIISNYSEDEKIQKKIKQWIVFHREKKEIRFEHDTWIFDTKPKGILKQAWKKKMAADRIRAWREGVALRAKAAAEDKMAALDIKEALNEIFE